MKRAIVSSLIVIAVFASSFFFLSSKQEKRLGNALTLFLSKDIIGAEDLLCDIEQEYQNFQAAPYKGFVALAKEDFQKSQQYFHQSLYSLHNDEEMMDLLLGKALCCYQQHQVEEMSKLLDLAQSIDRKSSQFQFVKSLYNYEMKNYSQFLLYCDNYKEFKRNWTQGILETQFPSSWIDIHKAHAMIELGQYLEGRSILEKYLDVSLLFQKESELAAFYLAFSYLKESQNLEFAEKKSFFKIALFYLERSGDNFAKCPTVTHFIIDEFSKLLQEENGYVFALIHVLEKKQDFSSLEYAAHTFHKLICEKKLSVAFCQMIKQEFPQGIFHKYLVDKLLSSFENDLTKKNSDPAYLWNKLEAITSNIPKSRLQTVIRLLEDKIHICLQTENANLKETFSCLTLYQMLNPGKEAMNRLANSLLNYGMHYWRKDQEELKGMNLIKIALQLACEETRKTFELDIHDFFIALYIQAQQANLVGRLALLYDAFEELKISFNTLATRDELANHVADAAYFFSAHDYPEAKLHAAWVIKLEPTNEDAIRYVGLSSFYLGLYSEAIQYLKKLTYHDLEVKEALTLCESYFAKETLAHVIIDKCQEINCNQ